MTVSMSVLVVANSPSIQMVERMIFEDLTEGKTSSNFSTINDVKDENFCTASRKNNNTSDAANSLVSDRNSTKTGMILAATSGN